MKRQALAFFTMFSLLMMLSIYYISLPSDVVNQNSEIQVMQPIEDSKEEIEESLNNEIIASDSTTEQEKNEAILSNEELKDINSKEQEYMTMILALGYESEVSIEETTIHITIMKETASDEIASNVFKLIYNEVGNSFFIEVSFNS